MVMTKNIMILGYTYVKHKLQKTPDIFYKLTHTNRITAWITSRLVFTQELLGMD